MDKGSDRFLTIIAVAFIAFLLIGEAIVYTSGRDDYGSSAKLVDGDVEYVVSAEGSKVYSVVVSENGGHAPVSQVYFYFDEDRPVNTGDYTLDQREYLGYLEAQLGVRGVSEVVWLDAEELGDRIEADIGSSCAGKGLVCISGALPDTVYTGAGSDPIFEWMSAGGSLFWTGGLTGEAYSTEDGIVHVSGYQELFFGAECLNTDGPEKAFSEASGGYTGALSLQCNDVTFGVDTSLVPEGRAALGLGFEEDGYTSVSLVQFGDGMVCVFGGMYPKFQESDIAQVIAAGLGPESRIVGVAEGSVSGTSSGTVRIGLGHTNVSAYIYLGGYYLVYGSLEEL